MISLAYDTLQLPKRISLAISRGTRSESRLAWVRLTSSDLTGWGEAGEYSIGSHGCTLEGILEGLEIAKKLLEHADPLDRRGIDLSLAKAGCNTAVRSAVNQALWDWLGLKVGLPVYQLLGTTAAGAPPCSVTIGIAPPDEAVDRVRKWNELGVFRAWKVKLGSPAGLDFDRLMFSAVLQALPVGTLISVDANGGWTLAQAIVMCRWLADHGVEHVEQPLARGQEADLTELRRESRLPLIADESCLSSREIPALAGRVDGINIKLFKCGGFDEALRMIATARAHGLRVMLGCYGNTLLSNTAAAHLGGLVDYVDLDSHWNLLGDPFEGATLHQGALTPSARPGFGVTYVPTHQATIPS